MATPVVVVSSGGIPITETDLGVPMTVADNGFGIAVTIVAAGGLPVALEGGSSHSGSNLLLRDGVSNFLLRNDTDALLLGY